MIRESSRGHRPARSLAGLVAGSMLTAAAVVGAAPAGATQATVSGQTYTLVQGDTLWGVARRFGTTIAALAQANHIADLNNVRYGTRLVVPGAPSTGGQPSASGRTYTLVQGDTLWAVARRFGVTVAALARANHIADPNKARYGTRLAIPASSSGAARPATAGLTPQVTANRADLRNHFRRAAVDAGVPVSLIEGLAWQESGWQQQVRSGAGAMGVGQLTMDTVAFVNAELVGRRLDPTQAADNISMSAAYLAWLLRQTNGDARLAIGAYYQGLASVRRLGLIPETSHYVDNVMALSYRFAAGLVPVDFSSP